MRRPYTWRFFLGILFIITAIRGVTVYIAQGETSAGYICGAASFLIPGFYLLILEKEKKKNQEDKKD